MKELIEACEEIMENWEPHATSPEYLVASELLKRLEEEKEWGLWKDD